MMKRYYFFLFLSLLSGYSFAQPVFQSNDIAPIAGMQVIMHYSTTNPNQGMSGANVTWNFSNLTYNNSYTTVYENAVSTPYFSNFQNSTLASHSVGNSQYNYYYISSAEMSFVGAKSASNYFQKNTNNKTLLPFPLNFQDSIFDTYKSNFYYGSFACIDTGTSSFIYDGYGTLILPSGTFTNVVRIRIIEKAQSICNSGTSSSVITSYYWFKPGIKHALMFIQKVSGTSGSGTYTYYSNSNPSNVINMVDNSQIYVYPNPNTGQFTISSNEFNENLILRIYNSIGHEVYNEKITRQQQTITANLISGIYFLKLQSDGQIKTGTIIIN